MSKPQEQPKAVARPTLSLASLSLDWWAVLLSLAVALLIRFDVIHSIKW